jgi:gamma-glutamyltranspeptidase/glutathione hydrolase
MTRGIVVCPERAAAKAGAFAFKQGGNAVDAAVATAFAQGVINPLLCGLGGTAEMLVYSSAERKLFDVDGLVAVPGGCPPDTFAERLLSKSETIGRYAISDEANQLGYQSVMIPGLVRALGTAFERYSSHRVSWAQLLLPAMQFAKEGSFLTPYLGGFFAKEPGEFEARPGYPSLQRKVEAFKGAANFLFPDGNQRQLGSTLIQPDLFQTLRTLSLEGANSFYSGAIADAIAREFQASDGFLNSDDLDQYKCYVTDASMVPVGDGLMIGVGPLPSAGVQLAQMLRLAEAADLSEQHNSAQYVDCIARIMRAVFYDQQDLKVLPDGANRSINRYISEERTAELLAEVNDKRSSLHNGHPNTTDGTTHVTTWDEHGNIVSLTHSIGSKAGSGVLSEQLGFFYNNFLGHLNPISGSNDSIAPGARLGGLCPSLLFEKGDPFLALGAPGGSRIITSQFQSILNVLKFGRDIQTAVTESRCHSEENPIIHVEPDLASRIGDDLEAMGNLVNCSTYMARAEGIFRLPDGQLQSGTDPRGGMGVEIA